MTVCLLDANVLIAIIDTQHRYHAIATIWFETHRLDGWATCPLTQNATLRIIGNPRYNNSMQTPAAVVPYLVELVKLPAHVFWPDDVSLIDDAAAPELIVRHDDVTDRSLLNLARAHDGILVTFDRRIAKVATPDCLPHLQVLDL